MPRAGPQSWGKLTPPDVPRGNASTKATLSKKAFFGDTIHQKPRRSSRWAIIFHVGRISSTIILRLTNLCRCRRCGKVCPCSSIARPDHMPHDLFFAQIFYKSTTSANALDYTVRSNQPSYKSCAPSMRKKANMSRCRRNSTLHGYVLLLPHHSISTLHSSTAPPFYCA